MSEENFGSIFDATKDDGIDLNEFRSSKYPQRKKSIVNQFLTRLDPRRLSCKNKTEEIRKDDIEFGTVLGEGAFGIVYKGLLCGKLCALKTLKQGTSRESQEHERLTNESLILSKIGAHASIVGYYGKCCDQSISPVLVLEYVDGITLEEYLRDSAMEKVDLTKVLIYSFSATLISVWSDVKSGAQLVD